LQKSLKNQDKQLSDIEKLQKAGKEKESLEFKISKSQRFHQTPEATG
jgi:hypothetical protein